MNKNQDKINYNNTRANAHNIEELIERIIQRNVDHYEEQDFR